jgi:hypothetical protein
LHSFAALQKSHPMTQPLWLTSHSVISNYLLQLLWCMIYLHRTADPNIGSMSCWTWLIIEFQSHTDEGLPPERCSLPSCHFRSGLALIWNRSWTSASSMTSVKAVQQSIGCRIVGPGFHVFSTLTQGVCTIGCCLDVKVFRCWELQRLKEKNSYW